MDGHLPKQFLIYVLEEQAKLSVAASKGTKNSITAPIKDKPTEAKIQVDLQQLQE